MDAPAVTTLSDGYAEACRTTDPADWTTGECDRVLDALGSASHEADSLSARVRSLVARDLLWCDDPPDLNGQCLRCGRTLAAPVAAHKRGCVFAPVTVVARLAVRATRYSRSVRLDLRGHR